MRNNMTVSEKIQDREEKKAAALKRIEKERQKIRQLETEIDELHQLEIKGLIKELDMPYKDFIEMIKDLKGTPQELIPKERTTAE